MANTNSWELQLAPLVNTGELLHEYEPDNSMLAGFKLPKETGRAYGRGNHQTSKAAQDSTPLTRIEDKATHKVTKERVTILSYPMDGNGASRCMREGVLLKRPTLWAGNTSPSIRRGLQHIVAPLGIWTATETSYLHLVLRNPGITPLSKVLDSAVSMPAELIRSVLRGVLEGLELCHGTGVVHCSVNPDTVLVHTCSHYHEPLADCSLSCDFSNAAHRPYPMTPVLAQLTSFENSVEFLPTLGSTSHLSSLHSSMPAYWSAPELCGIVVRPKSKLRKRQMRESGGKVDVWSVGMLALTLIERNIMLSPLSPRTKEALSTVPLRDLTSKQMSRLKTSPKILQARRWTTLAQDFVHSCLRIDHTTRPTVSALLKHPFFTNTNEPCLMSLSDVSESENSPLDETYEDSTTYIPAPDSDSLGGSSDDWSEGEEETLPHSGRSHYAPSAPSLSTGGGGGNRTSSEDSDFKRTGSYPEDNLVTSSDESSTGSVVIIDSDSEISTRIFPPVKPRKRGKSDAGFSDQQITPSPENDNPLLLSPPTVHSGPHTPPQRSRHGPIRRKASSEFIETTGVLANSSNAPISPSGTSSSLFSGDGESPPSVAPAMITVHTHKSPGSLKSSHESEKASRRFGASSASSNTSSAGSSNFQNASSSVQQGTGVSSSGGGRAPGSASAPTATVFVVRDRTPSPAKHALPSLQTPGRRSSLPLLPVLDAIGGHVVSVHPAPVYQMSPPVSPLHSTTSSSSSLSWGSGGPTLVTNTQSSIHLTPLPVPPYASSKAATLSEPFRPVHLSRTMRSRSEDTLIDKETAIAIHSGHGANPTVLNVANAGMYSPRSDRDLGSSSGANLDSSGGSQSMQRSSSGQSLTSSPSSSNLTGSPMSLSPSSGKSKKKSKKHGKSEATIVSVDGLLASTDEGVRKEIEEIELKWLGELRKRAKTLEQKEKDITEKAAARLRTVRKHYDSQIALISKRGEQRTTELKNRMAAEKTKLMSERAKELDREALPINRRNSFSGGFAMASSSSSSSVSSFTSSGSSVVTYSSPSGSPTSTPHASSASSTGVVSPLSSRRPSFPRRVLHLNYEKSVHDMDRRHLIERQEIELKSMEDSAAVEREYAVQKYLVEQGQLETMQEARRQCMDDTYALKWKMNEEIKACTRKNISRRMKKLVSSDGALRALSDDPTSSVEIAIWQILLAPMPSARATTDAPPGSALSSMEITPEYVLTPAELSGGVYERYQKSVELQKWRQEEELALLSLDVKHAEQHRADATSMNQHHALELTELQSGFEAHYVHTRQEFLSERLNRLMYYENELVDLRYRYARRMVVKTNETEAKEAYESLDTLQKADLDTIALIHAAKRQELTTLVASVYPIKPISASSSFALLPSTDDSYDY